MKFAYVILHYLAINETIECIESILNMSRYSSNETSIIVVDNGSDKEFSSYLKSKYQNNDNIYIIRSEYNLGFARGNNLGFSYAKNILNSDYIILMNNDTVIKQRDFNEIIIKKYEEYNFDILGPDIITLDNKHQNPLKEVNWTKNKIRKFRFKKRIEYILSNFKIFNKLLKINENAYLDKKIDKDIIDTSLHGSCLIFSKNYINIFNGLYDKTYLYMEEDILRLIAKENNLKMIYTPELRIYHKEDIATNMANKNEISKKHQIYKYLLKSSKEYLKLMNEYNNDSIIYHFTNRIIKKFKGNKYVIDKKISTGYLINLLSNRFIMLLRGIIRFRCKSFIGKKVTLKSKNKITINNGVTINNNCYIDALSSNGIYFGNNSNLGSNSIIKCSGNLANYGNGFHLGENSSLAENTFVGATGGVWIGNNVIGGQNIRFHSSNHNFNDLNKLIKDQGITKKGIYIGNNCWIGSGVVFLDGVVIDDGCVIAANSVVTKSFPKNSVIAGNPAKVIKIRGN